MNNIYDYPTIESQEKILLKARDSLVLGLRLLVIKTVTAVNKKDFILAVEKGDELALIEFGYKYVPDFSQKLTTLINEIRSYYKQTIQNQQL